MTKIFHKFYVVRFSKSLFLSDPLNRISQAVVGRIVDQCMASPKMAEIRAIPKIVETIRRQIADGAKMIPGWVHLLPDQIRHRSDWMWAEGCEISLWQTGN